MQMQLCNICKYIILYFISLSYQLREHQVKLFSFDNGIKNNENK